MARRRMLVLPQGRRYNKPQTFKTTGGRKSTGTRRSSGYKRTFNFPKGMTYTPNDAIKIFDNWEEISGALNDPEQAKEKLQALITNKLKQGLKANTKVGISIVEKPTEFTGGEEPTAPAHVENTSKRVSLANVSDDRTVHKTSYHTGLKPSRALRDAVRENGGVNRVLSNSMITYSTVASRNILTQGSGFNQKQYHVPSIRFQVPITFVKDLIGYNLGLAQDSNDFSRAFSNVLNIKQQFMIKNTSLNLPMEFTIHLVKIKDRTAAAASLNSLLVRTFYDQVDWAEGGGDDFSAGAQKKGLVPKYYQHSPLVFEGLGIDQAGSVQVSNKMKSLNYSANFRVAAKIVESFTKTIPPGDYWNFSHTHHCGSGIDLEAIFRQTDDGFGTPSEGSLGFGMDEAQFIPFHYGVIFEVKGKMAEAYEIPELNAVNTYLGTSPTYYAYESKTSAYFASATPLANNNDNNFVATPGYRVYQSSDRLMSYGAVSTVREKFIDQSNLSSSILDPASAGSVGLAYVPMASSVVTSAVQHEGVRVPG